MALAHHRTRFTRSRPRRVRGQRFEHGCRGGNAALRGAERDPFAASRENATPLRTGS
jgi:hypothetical protein